MGLFFLSKKVFILTNRLTPLKIYDLCPTKPHKYLGSDANLIEQANLNKGLLIANLEAFQTEDETMDATFVTAYAADITAAEVVDTDDLVAGTLGIDTAAVKEAEAVIAKKVQQVRYYVLEAFGNDKPVQHAFGLDKWDKARDSQTETLQFLETMHKVAQRYQDELTAAGFGADRIASILTVRQSLENANSEQELYRSGRPALTAERIGKYNNVYDKLTRVNRLAQVVFADNYEMRKQFVFDPHTTDTSTEYADVLAAEETKTIATIPYRANRHITLTNTGDTSLTFSLRIIEGTQGGTPVELASGGSVDVAAEALNTATAATKLVVQNMGSAAGAYNVTVAG